jgi:6-aminohexanoate-oligomer endohydrolase
MQPRPMQRTGTEQSDPARAVGTVLSTDVSVAVAETIQPMKGAALPRSNDNTALVPRTSFTGPVLDFDFPGVHIGVAEYDEGPTGCTVFYFPTIADMSIDVRGGSPGWFGDHSEADAICLAGGSLYGLESAIGVQAELFAMRDYSTKWDDIALVSGAIIMDYRARDNAIYPDKALGRAALRAAQPGIFPLGPHGAGRSATVGKALGFEEREPGGQGGAFRQVGPTKIAFFSVVNALGAIVDRQGTVVRGCVDQETRRRRPYVEGLMRDLTGDEEADSMRGNTTLSVLVTNQKLPAWPLRQLGRQVHSSMARAIQPFHGLTDGDVLFAVTTNEVENDALGPVALGALASELAWDAVLSSFAE